MVARVAVALVAVLALGWLAVLYRDQRVANAASDRIFYENPLPPAEFERQMDRISGAQLLDLDRSWRLVRVRYLLLYGRPRRALEEAERFVRERAGQHRGLGSGLPGRARRRPAKSASGRRRDPPSQSPARRRRQLILAVGRAIGLLAGDD